MAKIGVADWGMYVWYGGHYDYEERVKSIKEIGFPCKCVIARCFVY